MAENKTATTFAREIQLFSHHCPKLQAGRYEISVVQDLSAGGKALDQAFTAKANFVVETNRFSLEPNAIYKVFPPEGGLGDHSNVLPHIVFSRSTLPWERASGAGPTVPWLALLLFDEHEKPTPEVITLEALQKSRKVPAFSEDDLNLRNPTDDHVTVIDIGAELAKQIQPTGKELEYLAHVQVEAGLPSEQRNETAVVICNRLPAKQGISTVHLVSVEGYYKSDGSLIKFTESVRFVSLKSWSFACIDRQQTFKGLLKAINSKPSTLRIPDNKNETANQYVQRGMVPLQHALRSGGQTVSFYHGPLTTGTLTRKIELPVAVGDKLLRFDPAIGMFDVSYAAAWQLGRLLALQSKQFSIGLYNWKRTQVQSLKRAEQIIRHPHITATARSVQADELPDTLKSWLNDLKLLKGVPFNYLVPDERMLPQESIRFFQMDEIWIQCLLDGAFSIGRALSSHCDREKTFTSKPRAHLDSAVTGFLLRSDVVSGWPGLLVDATDKDDRKLDCWRKECLSPNVFVCFFKGILSRVTLHLKPEDLHFGVDSDKDGFYKDLRENRLKEDSIRLKSLPWKSGPKDRRTLDIVQLATEITKALHKSAGSFSSADFALEMIEGVDIVEFGEHQ